jgi:hypothetical protein
MDNRLEPNVAFLTELQSANVGPLANSLLEKYKNAKNCKSTQLYLARVPISIEANKTMLGEFTCFP